MAISWNETVRRDQGWPLAREYYLANGSHEAAITEARTKRCIESNDRDAMAQSCWDQVEAQYEIGDVE